MRKTTFHLMSFKLELNIYLCTDQRLRPYRSLDGGPYPTIKFSLKSKRKFKGRRNLFFWGRFLLYEESGGTLPQNNYKPSRIFEKLHLKETIILGQWLPRSDRQTDILLLLFINNSLVRKVTKYLKLGFSIPYGIPIY